MASVFMALTPRWLSPSISVEQCVEAKCSALLLGHTLSFAKYISVTIAQPTHL